MRKKNRKSYQKSPRLVAVDLFCGAGGLTFGLRKSGINVQFGIDVDRSFKKTYERNNPGASFLHKDIRKVSGKEISNTLKLKKKQKFLLAACAPCQPFSRQNKKSVLKGFSDDRSDLIMEVLRIIKEMRRKPRYLFIENVPGLGHKDNDVYKKFKHALKKLGYKLADKVTNAADYGVPQNRKRLIVVAKLGKQKICFPSPTHGTKENPYITVREALKGLPNLKAGGKSKTRENHWVRKISSLNLRRIKNIPKNGGSRTALRSELVLKCHKRAVGHKDVYGRMSLDRPAPTITCRCNSLSNGRFGHPTQNRAISIREAARLQSFPDSYIFYGTGIDSEAKQVGNAVPVKLAQCFGKFLNQLEEN